LIELEDDEIELENIPIFSIEVFVSATLMNKMKLYLIVSDKLVEFDEIEQVC